MTWPDDYLTWLHAVTAAKTAPADCMLAVALTRSMARGRNEISMNELGKGAWLELGTIDDSVAKLKRLGLVRVVNKRGGGRSNEYALTFPEVASVSN